MMNEFKRLTGIVNRDALYVWRRISRPATIRLDRMVVPMNVMAMTADARHGFWLGEYEREERSLLAATLQPDDVVLELGTGLGVISTLAALILGSGKNVHSYEANPKLEADIRRVYEANGVKPNFHPFPLGLSECDITFYVSPNFFSSTTVDHGQSAEKVTVRQQPISDVLTHLRPSYLIMDIEGGEVDLVPAMDLSSIDRILIEVHPHKAGPAPVSAMIASILGRGFCLDTRRSSRDVLFFFRAETRHATA
ncbi:hypothetical protein GCM10011505_23630 [Tistrella bauzanensis]|uniref:Methyltransferase FkbM domain-containing protein n=2 Tax=Tistrella bauzanensis TaxID=657419 RepID=A0ABQ1IHA3_9PROT|nr:FkbM family methyltransferase [Tistrella bauzanensis]GGB41463.1 hypothetical protein GCM10011505_23630 [Tistrella bauzanensis]